MRNLCSWNTNHPEIQLSKRPGDQIAYISMSVQLCTNVWWRYTCMYYTVKPCNGIKRYVITAYANNYIAYKIMELFKLCQCSINFRPQSPNCRWKKGPKWSLLTKSNFVNSSLWSENITCRICGNTWRIIRMTHYLALQRLWSAEGIFFFASRLMWIPSRPRVSKENTAAILFRALKSAGLAASTGRA